MAVEKQMEKFKNALARLEEVCARSRNAADENGYLILRDSAIKRFEFTVDALWRTLKAFLNDVEGVGCASPKKCVRQFFSYGYVSEDEAYTLLRMRRSRVGGQAPAY